MKKFSHHRTSDLLGLLALGQEMLAERFDIRFVSLGYHAWHKGKKGKETFYKPLSIGVS